MKIQRKKELTVMNFLIGAAIAAVSADGAAAEPGNPNAPLPFSEVAHQETIRKHQAALALCNEQQRAEVLRLMEQIKEATKKADPYGKSEMGFWIVVYQGYKTFPAQRRYEALLEVCKMNARKRGTKK